MPRSQPKSDASCDHFLLVTDVVTSTGPTQAAACATLQRIVDDHVRTARIPINWLAASLPARRVIARLTWQRLTANGYALLKEWCCRTLRAEDAATFSTMLTTVVWFVSIEYADVMDHRG